MHPPLGLQIRPIIRESIDGYDAHPSIPLLLTIPPTAEEYLLRVRLESEALPEIAEAEGVDPTQWEGRQTAYMQAQVN